MKTINTFCEWQLKHADYNTWYGQLEIIVGSIALPAIALLSIVFSFPVWILYLALYKAATEVLLLIAIALKPKGQPDSLLQTLAVSLHLIDVAIVAPFLSKK